MIAMALPLNNNDDYSEKATSVDDYKLTCTQFIKDISFDYIKWIEYYKLPLAEDKQRRNKINYVIKTSNTWIQHVATTIKGIDIIIIIALL